MKDFWLFSITITILQLQNNQLLSINMIGITDYTHNTDLISQITLKADRLFLIFLV